MYWSHWQTDKVQGPSKHSSFKLSSKSLVIVFSSQKCFFGSIPSSPGKGPGSSRPFTTVHPQQQHSRWHLAAAGPHRLFHRERHPMRVGTRMRARVFGGLGRLKPPSLTPTKATTTIHWVRNRNRFATLKTAFTISRQPNGLQKRRKLPDEEKHYNLFFRKSSDFVLNSL